MVLGPQEKGLERQEWGLVKITLKEAVSQHRCECYKEQVAVWRPARDSHKGLVDTGGRGRSSLGLTQHRPILGSEETLLRSSAETRRA